MKRLASHSFLVSGLALLGLLLLGSSAETAIPGWSPSGGGSASWLPAFLVAAVPPSAPPSSDGGLPRSARLESADVCSTTTSDHYPRWCSSGGAEEGQECSARLESGTVCSALQTQSTSGGGSASCSALGYGEEEQNRCSILKPLGSGGGSHCSALGAGHDRTSCSVIGSHHDALCSTKLRGRETQGSNTCSTADGGLATWGELPPKCSVIALHETANACSAFHPGSGKFCSAVAAESFCSILYQGKGQCTALYGADEQFCSVGVAVSGDREARCSTLFGDGPCAGR